jgi:predicted site-specific integrase-resolvase
LERATIVQAQGASSEAQICSEADAVKNRFFKSFRYRLVRFGFEWFEKFCKDHGVFILVMNADTLSPEQEMTKDLLSIIHCFSSRLYGLRKYKKKIIEMARGNENC